MSILEVKNLKKNFGSLEVLKGIDFSLEKGEFAAVVGESGSGKSTFSSIVAGIQQRDSGRLLLRGEDYAPTSSVDVCENGYEHHVCFVRGHVADILEEALTKYMGIPVYRHR